MADLTTIDRLKQWLGETSDANDALLSRLISAASEYVERYCQRRFTSTTYTEYYDGSGTDVLTLRNFPIISVTSIAEGGQTGITSGEDPYATPAPEVVIYKEQGQLMRPFTKWFSFRRYYKVVYVAGYASVPAEIVDATLNVAALLLKEKDHVGMGGKSAGQQTTDYVRSLPESAQRTMDLYRDVALGRET